MASGKAARIPREIQKKPPEEEHTRKSLYPKDNHHNRACTLNDFQYVPCSEANDAQWKN